MASQNRFELVAFDADDTLWHNESVYLRGRERATAIVARYGEADAFEKRLDEVEVGNLQYYGYGVMSFILSAIEAAIDVTEGEISAGDVQELIALSKEMLTHEVQLFDGVEDALSELSEMYPLLLITKGDLRHQQEKVSKSGLAGYFRGVEVVSDKTPGTYERILKRYQVEPARFLMVGNSLRSDIAPVLELGGWAVHVPNDLTWDHEMAVSRPETEGRFFEVEHVGQVPGLVERLGRHDGGG
ncbi:MAG: HAD family hydrolase [Candidatus Promineifilaceae bacterium]|nr:HAD family hydrolase [Candidatus Promineifilaceae bacterium]